MPRPVGRSSEAGFRRGACSSPGAMRRALLTSTACVQDLSDASAGPAMAQSGTRATSGRRWPARACSCPRERNSLVVGGGFELACARLCLHRLTLDRSSPACSSSRVLMEVRRQSPSLTSVSGGRGDSGSCRSSCVMSTRHIDVQSDLGSSRCMNRSSVPCPCCRSSCLEVSGRKLRWMVRAR